MKNLKIIWFSGVIAWWLYGCTETVAPQTRNASSQNGAQVTNPIQEDLPPDTAPVEKPRQRPTQPQFEGAGDSWGGGSSEAGDKNW